MTPLSKVLALFPSLVMALAATCVGWLVWVPGPLPALALFGTLYVFPLLAFHIHQQLFPLKDGISNLVGEGYSPWWGTHQIQLVYIAFPALEIALRLVPGVFSAWLRLWGSKVGRHVYWTPHLELGDRSMLEVGDGVVWGHRVGISGHIIKPRRGNLMLLCRRVRIGSGVFIGAGALIGPGAVISDGAFLTTGQVVRPGQKVRA
jgi:hypothetical protein